MGVPPQPPTISFYSSSPLQLSFYSSSRRLICLPVQYKTDRRALNSMGFTALCKNPVQLSGLALNHARKFFAILVLHDSTSRRRTQIQMGIRQLSGGKKEPRTVFSCTVQIKVGRPRKLAIFIGEINGKSKGKKERQRNRRGKKERERKESWLASQIGISLGEINGKSKGKRQTKYKTHVSHTLPP